MGIHSKELLKELFNYDSPNISPKRKYKLKLYKEWNGQDERGEFPEPWNGKSDENRNDKVPLEMLWYKDQEIVTKF